jgi:tetratricopeptide (TPR) repeat protein
MSAKKTAGGRRVGNALDLYEKAIKALGKRDFEKAQGHLETLVASHAEERDLLERARVYLAVCARALEKRPGFRPKTVEEHLRYGVYLHNRGDFRGALKQLNQAAELEPKNDDVLYCMAAAASRAGDPEAAVKALRSAIASSPASRAQARWDADFDPIREDDDFAALVHTS